MNDEFSVMGVQFAVEDYTDSQGVQCKSAIAFLDYDQKHHCIYGNHVDPKY